MIGIEEHDGFYYPIIKINNQAYYNRLLMSKNNKADFKGAIKELRKLLINWAYSQYSCGLKVFAYGDDDEAQEELEVYFEEKYGISVY